MWKLASGYFLSLSLTISFPALSDGALLSNSRLATASSHSLRDFYQHFFFFFIIFVSAWLSLLCRCNESFRFFGSKWARSTRNARRGHLVGQFAPSRPFWSTNCNNVSSMECIWPLKFLGNANAMHGRREGGGDPEGIQRRGNCVSRYEICKRATRLGWSVVLPSFVKQREADTASRRTSS